MDPMPYNPKIHRRRSIRLPDYDYSQNGAYFVTLCTHQQKCLFGKIADGEMLLNEYGKIILATWQDLPNHNTGIELDQFIIMPNHIHGIIVLVGAGSKPALNGNASLAKNTDHLQNTHHTQNKKYHQAQNQSNQQNKKYNINSMQKQNWQNNRNRAGCNQRAGLEPAPTHVLLSEIVRQLKTFSARRINRIRNTPGQPVWQRNYYEHIIRHEKSLENIRQYILNNPAQWEEDKLNPTH